jgi:transcription factor SPN1
LNEFYEDFEVALEQIKTKRNSQCFDEVEQDEYVIVLRRLMLQAAQKDIDLNENKEPATEKLKLLPFVLETLERKNFHEKLLENYILEPIKIWLEPLADGSLPSINIRKSLLEALEKVVHFNSSCL